MSDIVGKWVLQEGVFKGLWFEFRPDGTYYSELPRLIKVTASGTYTVSEGGLIDTHQTQHTMNLLGNFYGRYEIEGDTMRLLFGPAPGGDRPADLSKAPVYIRMK
ncbi:MAG: hypothetical protein WHV44_07725 [Anaerolineales bacterium]